MKHIVRIPGPVSDAVARALAFHKANGTPDGIERHGDDLHVLPLCPKLIVGALKANNFPGSTYFVELARHEGSSIRASRNRYANGFCIHVVPPTGGSYGVAGFERLPSCAALDAAIESAKEYAARNFPLKCA